MEESCVGLATWTASCDASLGIQSDTPSSRKADEDGHFNDDDEDHFLGIDSEDGHEDEEPLPPLALPLQNDQKGDAGEGAMLLKISSSPPLSSGGRKFAFLPERAHKSLPFLPGAKRKVPLFNFRGAHQFSLMPPRRQK
ncbi:hypothetical protein CEXT_24371 [Caerostris extrusa]|uniref:Uncharacterized protein n=1 Tax=Caerostris extrusa TaxID=172846 RepID=A0AAV4RK79_CAEEX|nr:hypothetical protein CEXT_24371 [Caerostris extrusa]